MRCSHAEQQWLQDYGGELHVRPAGDGFYTLVGDVPDVSALFRLMWRRRDSSVILRQLQAEKQEKECLF